MQCPNILRYRASAATMNFSCVPLHYHLPSLKHPWCPPGMLLFLSAATRYCCSAIYFCVTVCRYDRERAAHTLHSGAVSSGMYANCCSPPWRRKASPDALPAEFFICVLLAQRYAPASKTLQYATLRQDKHCKLQQFILVPSSIFFVISGLEYSSVIGNISARLENL